MADNTLRQWAMLRMIPRLPRKVDAATLLTKLTAQGYSIHLRGVQRDLITLSRVLPLVSDNAKPQGWSWRADADILEIPALDPQAALTFSLVESYMKPLLPASTLDYLNPWFKAAHGVLELHGNGLAKWPDKIRVLPRGQTLLPASIDPQIQTTIYQALLEEKRVAIQYRKRGASEAKAIEISPLALVVRDPMVYLIATAWNYDDPLHFVLHRIEQAELLDQPAHRPAGFDLDAHISKGEFGVPVGGTIQLVAEFNRYAAAHLYETPLSADQVITEIDDDNFRLQATVVDTDELRAWLRSFGERVVVLEPEGVV